MNIFTNADDARRWLGERLDRLESSIEVAPALTHLVNEGRREVLLDVEASPHRFAQDVNDRVRRYSAQISAATLARLDADGFQPDALRTLCVELLGDDFEHGLDVLTAMANLLRARVNTTSQRGTQLFEEGRDQIEDLLQDIDDTMKDAEQTWRAVGPGRHLSSALPWRRRSAQGNSPMDDHAFRKAATDAVKHREAGIERALIDIGKGSVQLALSKYYGDVATRIGHFRAAGENLARRGKVLALKAGQRLSNNPNTLEQAEHNALATLDVETLDAILDRLDIDALSFLRHGDLNLEDLKDLDTEALDAYVHAFIDAQLGGLDAPSLADALGGITGDTALLRKQVRALLARGQPLMHYNDDIPLSFDGGMSGQHTVVAEVTDTSLNDELRAACRQMGLPEPTIHHIPAERDGVLEIHLAQFVAGMPFFAQVDRLEPLIAIHTATMAGDAASLGPVAVDYLRDTTASELLPSLLPEPVRRAFEQERALERDPTANAQATQDPDRKPTMTKSPLV